MLNHIYRLLVFVCLLMPILSCFSQEKLDQVADTTFVNLRDYSSDFVFDMKYATEDNFLKAAVYECAECLLRAKTVRALISANKEFLDKGYAIKLFDCYRPIAIQEKMFSIVPNPTYVADPKKGSIHNKGGAVDITLVDKMGNELPMGTKFDHFGIESSHSYQALSKKVKANRLFLKSVMIKHGFNSFDSEWWHYNLKSGLQDKVSNQKWPCN